MPCCRRARCAWSAWTWGRGSCSPALRSDPRVVCIEKCNARELSAEALTEAGVEDASFDLIVGDLSFISQTLVWPAIVPLVAPVRVRC